MENLPFPDEIVLKILNYLSLGELIQCARVSKRLNALCEDKSLSYRSNMLVMQGLTVKGRKSISHTLIANPELTEVSIFPKIKVENRSVLEWGIEGEISRASFTRKSSRLFIGNEGLVYQINVVHSDPNKRVFLKTTQTVAKKLWAQFGASTFIGPGLEPHLFYTREHGDISDFPGEVTWCRFYPKL
jgi:hypothetical protein